jgi:hypothetical protein
VEILSFFVKELHRFRAISYGFWQFGTELPTANTTRSALLFTSNR